MTASHAPGPGLGILTDLARLRRDPLGTMLNYHRTYGDVVRIGDGPFLVHLLGAPEHADHVLRRRHANYDRHTRSAGAVRVITGESLLTNDGEAWRRHRLLMQPLFNKDALGSLNAIVSDAANAMIDRWLAARDVDIAVEMTRLTTTIASRAFFGTDVDEDLARLMPLILEETYERATALLSPGRPSRELLRARNDARGAVERILGRGDSPLLAHLRELPAEELRNETLALLLAGHETTSNALAWTFALLYSRVVRASGAPQGEGAPEARTAPDPTAAVQEAMRLYPPVWIVERRVIEDDVIGGFELAAGSIVYVSPYVLHRHREHWSDPERFDPSRFPDAARNPAYLPFGCGPHSCLGAAFAMIEAPLVVAAVRARCDVVLQTDVIEPQAWVTLRPKDGVPARISMKA
jgi:cytochrome P450